VSRECLYPILAKLTIDVPESEHAKLQEYVEFAENFATGLTELAELAELTELASQIMSIAKSKSGLKHRYAKLDNLISQYVIF